MSYCVLRKYILVFRSVQTPNYDGQRAVEHTEPPSIRLDACGWELLGLQLMLQDLPASVTLWTGVVHLKAPYCGRTAAIFVAAIIATVGIK